MQTETRPYTREDVETDLAALVDAADSAQYWYSEHKNEYPGCDPVNCTEHFAATLWSNCVTRKHALVDAIADRARH